MENETNMVINEGVVVPESTLLKRERKNRYGSVPGLDDDELADPDELERQVMREEWAPVLALPVQKRRWGIMPAIDESGGVDWGAFGTVDFERTQPAFDKARYKAERLREELKDALIMFSIVADRLPPIRRLVLQYLRRGVLKFDHIVSEDLLALARLGVRVDRMRREIAEAQEVSAKRRRVVAAPLLP